MQKFKIKGYSISVYEQELEAETEDEAKDLFTEKWENVELEAEEEQLFLNDDDGYAELDQIYTSSEE